MLCWFTLLRGTGARTGMKDLPNCTLSGVMCCWVYQTTRFAALLHLYCKKGLVLPMLFWCRRQTVGNTPLSTRGSLYNGFQLQPRSKQDQYLQCFGKHAHKTYCIRHYQKCVVSLRFCQARDCGSTILSILDADSVHLSSLTDSPPSHLTASLDP